ncbi:MAG: hypothetical protein F6J97_22975 [Leptolyngbya sp. SIO4C1]|nr:hypothetical protein [Leptolyngbya sp. SIO4C1]
MAISNLTLRSAAALWGDSGEDMALDTNGTDLFQPAGELYFYHPGDSCDVIDSNVDMLWLERIHLEEITVSPTRNGKVQVSYQGQPILRMKGVELIRTEEGCFSLNYWLN